MSRIKVQPQPDQHQILMTVDDTDAQRAADLANALADAKVAVYPMDPAGLQAQSMFEASTRMRGNPVTASTASDGSSIGKTSRVSTGSRRWRFWLMKLGVSSA